MGDFSNSILLRVSLFPIEYYKTFNFTQTIDIINEIFSLSENIELGKDTICEVLYKYIPNLPKKERRLALKVKRFLYNHMEPISRTDYNIIYNIIDEEEKAIFTYDNAKRYNRIDLFSKLKNAFQNELSFINCSLAKLLDNNLFRTGLYLSSEELYDCIYKQEKKNVDYDLLSAVYRYYTKASMKTTPLATWIGIVSGTWGKSTEYKFGAENGSISLDANIALCKELCNFISPYIEFEKSMFVKNPTLTIFNEKVLYWRRKQKSHMTLCEIDCPEWLIHFFSRIPRRNITLSYINSLISELNSEKIDVLTFTKQLVDSDILRHDMEPQYCSENPLFEMSESVKKYTDDVKAIEFTDRLIILDDICKYNYSIESNNIISAIQRFNNVLNIIDNVKTKPSIRVNTRAPWKNVIVDDDVLCAANTAFENYARLYAILYEHKDPLYKFKENFIDNFGLDKNVPILLAERLLSKISKESIKNNILHQREWIMPKNNEGKLYYDKISEYISKSADNNYTIIKLGDDLFPKNDFIKKSMPEWIEGVFQFQRVNDNVLIVPEMISSQVGRLVGRYLKWLPKKDAENIEKVMLSKIPQYEDKVPAHFNISLNRNIDDVSFAVDGIEYEVEIYGTRPRKSKNSLQIGDIYIRLNSLDNSFSLCTESGMTIEPWVASTLSAGDDSLISIINWINKQNVINLNGHARSRWISDKPFLPRIEFGNLVVSRARWIINKSCISWLNNVAIDTLETFIESRKLLKEFNMPTVSYISSDVNPKPIFVDWDSIYGIEQITRIARASKEFIRFEECLPSPESHFMKDNLGMRYASEIWSPIRIGGK